MEAQPKMSRNTWYAVIALASATILFTPVWNPSLSDPTPDESKQTFHWPGGKRVAVSLSFDDARLSQIDRGLDVLNPTGVKVTFFVVPEGVKQRLEGWKRAVASGHEIASHSMNHPCTGNFPWSFDNALENYTLEQMSQQLDEANAEIQRLLGVRMVTFAYPCGQKFVGRGRQTKSYVPLVAEKFLVGRGYYDEYFNDPAFCDLAQAGGTAFDDMDYIQMVKLIAQAAKQGAWIIFAGHEIGERAFQVTDATALAALCRYMKDPANGIWVDTVKRVGRYVQQQRGKHHEFR
jgi:peptidoglycan/xylan/chitin deacetylase (PgdA/CDA1 family)